MYLNLQKNLLKKKKLQKLNNSTFVQYYCFMPAEIKNLINIEDKNKIKKNV